MNFRIVEVKRAPWRPFFYPQYETTNFWGRKVWKDIGKHYDFASSNFNHTKNFDSYTPYTVWWDTAKEIIENFKRYCKSNEEYTIIHPVT